MAYKVIITYSNASDTVVKEYGLRHVTRFLRKLWEKSVENRPKATPVLPWLVEMAFEDTDTTKKIEKIEIKRNV